MDQGAKPFITTLHYALSVLSLTALSLLAFLPQTAKADTQLPTIITEDTTWTESQSPYVGGGVTIASGVTVTAEPGVTVKLAGALTVEGTLNVEANPSNHALFTSTQDSAPGQWSGIKYMAGSAGSINYTDLRYGGAYGVNGMIETVESISVTNSSFTHSSTGGISVKAGSPTISGNTFSNNFRGIFVLAPGAPVIEQNTIEQSSSSEAVLFMGSAIGSYSPIQVTGNSFSNNAGNAFVMSAPGFYGWSGGDVSGNIFTDNGGKALYFQGGGLISQGLPQNVNQNSANGNGCDCAYLDSVDIVEPTTWQEGLTFVINGNIETMSPLTIEGGVVVKGEDLSNSRLQIELGDLTVQPGATFTSINDDSYGGDTEGNGGAIQPAPGDWGGISVSGPATATIGGARMLFGGRYAGGYGDTGMLVIKGPAEGTPVVMSGSTISKNANFGMYVYDYGGPLPQVTGNTFSKNTNYALYKQATEVLNAPGNNWGCATGPRPAGCGDLINEYVNPPPFDQPEISDGQCIGSADQCGEASDPVSMATGALTHRHEDLALSGKGPALEFARSYYSKDTADAGLGRGWSHSGILTASEDAEGAVTIRRADGRRDIYTFTNPGYSPPSGVHDVLVKDPDETFTLTGLDRTVYEFDVTGRIESVTDDHGQLLTYGYDSNGRLAKMTDTSGQSLNFSYDSTNHIISVADSTGRYVSYTYDADGNLATVTDPLGGVATYTYDSAGRMTAITDPKGVTFVQNTYDSGGRVTTQEDALGNQWTIDYLDSETRVTYPEGGVETFGFDDQQRVTSRTNQVGETTSSHYNPQGNIDLITRPGGAQYSFTYDANGNLISESHPEGGTRTYAYDSQNRITSYTDARDSSWAFTWSQDNDITEIEDPKQNLTSITYDPAGFPLTLTDPEDNVTTLGYDSRGNLTSKTNPTNDTTTYTYDSRNYMTSVTEPGENPTTYTRNALGDLFSATDPENSTISYTYNENGELGSLTDPLGNTWQVERNQMDRPTAIIDPKLNLTEIAYDGDSNPVTVKDRRGNTTTYSYSAADRLTQISRPQGGTYDFAYDGRGNVSSMTDPRGKTSSYAYDLTDRLTTVAEPESTTTSYTYDKEHNLTSAIDPRGNTTSFIYDSMNLLTNLTQPLGKETAYTYDKAQNLKTKTTSEGTLTYLYDEADRLLNIKEGEDTLRSYGYDPVGRMDSATGSTGNTITVSYDQADRVTQIEDGLGETSSLVYDASGNLTSQTDARGTVGYGYDDLNRLVSLTDPQGGTSSFTYDAERNLAGSDLPNSATTVNVFDKEGRLTRTKSTRDASVLQDFTYGYDLSGNRANKRDLNGRRTYYTYDGLNRLTRASKLFGISKKKIGANNSPKYALAKYATYAYDKAGNLNRKEGVNYRYNALNELLSSSDGATYSYDGAGRLTQKQKPGQSATYSWNLLDELTQVQEPSGTTSYTYDALGRRSARTSSGTTETAHYGDLSDVTTFDTGELGGVERSYVSAWPQASSNDREINETLGGLVNLPSEAKIDQVVGGLVPINPIGAQSGTKDAAGLIKESTGNQSSYPLADAHGDTTTVTNQSGQLTSSHAYSPWGEDISPTKLEMGYLGKYLRRTDTDTSLTQMGARQYAPGLGRFTSEDRVLARTYMGQSWNRNSYVFNRPLVLYDLDGSYSITLPGGLGGANHVPVLPKGPELENADSKTLRSIGSAYHSSNRHFFKSSRSLLDKCSVADIAQIGLSIIGVGKVGWILKAVSRGEKVFGPVKEGSTKFLKYNDVVNKTALAAAFGFVGYEGGKKCLN